MNHKRRTAQLRLHLHFHRFFLFTLALAALVCWALASSVVAPQPAFADLAGGTYDNVPWRITDDGVLEIGEEG